MTLLVARPPAQRRLTGPRYSIAAIAPVRLVTLLLLLGVGVVAVLVRLALLAVLSPPAGSHDYAAALVPLRADIVDRRGTPLARTIDLWSVGIRPGALVSDPAEIAGRLAQVLPEHDAAWYRSMLASGKNFVYLRRRASPEMVNALNALGEPAIAFAREPERVYPQGMLAAHALGFTRDGVDGLAGMERVLDKLPDDQASRARPLALSIDSRVQAALDSELGGAMERFKARGAAGVILDAQTGEVVAMTSFPLFDPNNVAGATADQIRNNVTQSVYELGSTFKPFAMAAAIDTGTVASMARRFDAREPIKVAGFPIHDDHPQRRFLNIPETLVHSSNIATARIADLVGGARLEVFYRQLGFAERPYVDLVERARPIWPDRFTRLRTMTTAYGHGIAVTPLHLAMGYAALVNGGIWRPASMLRLDPARVPAGRRVMSAGTSARMRQLLRLIVLEGTGRKAEAAGFRVGGKTGTAEVAEAGKYARNRNVSTFAAAFPMDAPRYVVVAMLDSPVPNAESAGLTTAAWTVAPVISRVIARAGPMLGVMPEPNRDIDVSDLQPLLWHAPGERPELAE